MNNNEGTDIMYRDAIYTQADSNTKGKAESALRAYESTGDSSDFEMAASFYELVASPNNDIEYTSKDRLNRAYLMDLHSNDYVKWAIELYNEVIKNDEEIRSEEYYKAHNQLTALLARNNRNHENINRYKKMLAKEPDNWHVYQLLYNSYFAAKQYDDAWLTIEAGLKLEPDNAFLLSEAGNALKAVGRYDEAIESFTRSHELNPDDAGPLYGKACLYMETLKHEEALAAWEYVVEWLEERGFNYEMEWPKREIENLEKIIAIKSQGV
jgi:Putative Zn-dependent protease, contains TPR repeats